MEWLNRWLFPIHFNSHITLDGTHHVKYGVVDYETFREDLSRWNLQTISGRLQKPVWFLKYWEKVDQSLLELNLATSLCCAFLLIGKPVFNEKELYMSVARLSYMGDMRFTLGM